MNWLKMCKKGFILGLVLTLLLIGLVSLTRTLTADLYSISPPIRLEATKLTQGCKDTSCRINHILWFTSRLEAKKYTRNNNLLFQDPVTTLNKGGNCEDFAILEQALFKAAGINSKIVCNLKHCWTEITGDNHG